jgi:glycolate oxidase
MRLPAASPDLFTAKEKLADELRRMLGAAAVITDSAELAAYECDALTAYRQPPLLVCLPASTQDTANAIKICKKYKAPIVPRGAGTSLAGGSLPVPGCVILGVARMKDVLEIDYANRFIRVQSGMTNLSVTNVVEDDGFFYAPDPSSQLACAIAGNIAMNSGGAHCLKYGVTTNNLLGVRMVTVDGDVVDIGGGYIDEGGLDLLGLICGSEGQLGVVTEAWLRILPKPEGARPMLMGFDCSAAAGAAVADIIKLGVIPVAIEYMDKPAIKVCEAFAKAGYPLDVEALLIIEVEGSDAEIDAQLEEIKRIAAPHGPRNIREAASAAESTRIWAGRKAAFGAMGRISDYMCMDGTIPTSALPQVLQKIAALSKKHGLGVANIFHAGDGNLHPLILFDANLPGDLEKAEAFGADVLTLCVAVGGCLTGEHGVGVEKRDLMTVQFSAVDLAQMIAIKDALDPDWLLNPGKVFPLDLSVERAGTESAASNASGQA